MNKQDIKQIAQKGFIIGRVKQDIFQVIKDMEKPSYISEYRIIEAINKIPSYRYQNLASISTLEDKYQESIRGIINEILEELNQTS